MNPFILLAGAGLLFMAAAVAWVICCIGRLETALLAQGRRNRVPKK